MENVSLTDYCHNVIKDNIDNYNGQEMYIEDLASAICEGMNADGTATYSSRKAEEYLKEWWDDCGDYLNFLNESYGETNANPFWEPEQFMVGMVSEGVRIIIGCTLNNLGLRDNDDDGTEIDRDNKITITDDIINRILNGMEYEVVSY